MLARICAFSAVLLVGATLTAQQPAKTKSPREAMQAVHDLVGPWKGTGEPKGTREEIQKGFWTDKMEIGWIFKGNDAWFKIDFKDSKYYKTGELRYLADKDRYSFTVTTLKDEKLTFVGPMEIRDTTKILNLDREDDKEMQRIKITLLHSNVFHIAYEVRPDGRPLFGYKWKVRGVRDGESFAAGSGKPECIVSGGAGTSAVSFMGKTYYVCCSGCRDEFNANAAKYVKEYEDKQAKLKKK